MEKHHHYTTSHISLLSLNEKSTLTPWRHRRTILLHCLSLTNVIHNYTLPYQHSWGRIFRSFFHSLCTDIQTRTFLHICGIFTPTWAYSWHCFYSFTPITAHSISIDQVDGIMEADGLLRCGSILGVLE